jgi:phosphoribosyl 1,2-cyclic phosphodiesterase
MNRCKLGTIERVEKMRFRSLASGSSGNCYYLETKYRKILVDAGLTGKNIVQKLSQMGIAPQEIDAILLSHEHRDHTKGAGVLSRRFNIPVFANAATWQGIGESIGTIRDENRCTFKTGEVFLLDDLTIHPFGISHDTLEPVSFCFFHQRTKISIATDLGIATAETAKHLQGSELLVVEANHDIEMLHAGRYPHFLKRRISGEKGHLSNVDAGNLICESIGKQTREIWLAHLSKENNTPQIAYFAVEKILQQRGIQRENRIKMFPLHREREGPWFMGGD